MEKNTGCVLSGTGIYVPIECITNEELVSSYNDYVERYNQSIVKKEEQLKHSSADFIIKASGIKKRHVIDKSGILDCERMRPRISARSNEEPSLQCEMSVAASKMAMERAKLSAKDIQAVIVSCANIQRAYPSVAVEVQNALGISGFAYDMNAGCASATFAIQTAINTIQQSNLNAVLIVNPEVSSGHANFRDRDSHFIFGDACSAVIVQQAKTNKNPHAFTILGTQLKTEFSNNIRNNFGFLTPHEINSSDIDNSFQTKNHINQYQHSDKLFSQKGRKVFKEVVPFVAETVEHHLALLNIQQSELKRLWLHQANVNMNRLIASKILNREPSDLEAPTILHDYGNTSSPGAIIAFHYYHEDLQSGDIGILCAFGAGYSVGNIVLQKI